MAEEKSRDLEQVKLILTFSVVVIILLAVSDLFFRKFMLKEITKKNQEIKSLLIDKKKYDSQLDDELEKSYDKIIFLDNISVYNEKIKNEVYSNAKLLENKILKKETDAKIAYLTFDDGPYVNTYNILEILDKYNVKATFFMLGKEIVRNSNKREFYALPVYREIIKKGHTIANHTFSHKIKDGIYTSVSAFLDDIDKNTNYLTDIGARRPFIMRFPGGIAAAGDKKKDIIKGLQERKFGWTDWTAADGDGMVVKDANEAWKNFVSTIDQNIEVVLFHDYSTITTGILPQAIEYLENNDYILLPLFYDSCEVRK